MNFIGHLDIMRYFQRAIRRAGIDVAYSEGFSPHMIVLPLCQSAGCRADQRRGIF